jgi:chaperonin GroES
MNEMRIIDFSDQTQVDELYASRGIARDVPTVNRRNDMKFEPIRDKVLVRRVEMNTTWKQEMHTLELLDRVIEPLHDRVLVERLPQEETIGRIIIPESARKLAVKCKVIAVGPGRWEDGYFTKTAVKPGDIVLVPGCGNTHPDWQAGQQILIQEADIGGILG